MKKLLSILLCLVLITGVCVLFVGCDNSKDLIYKNDLVQQVKRDKENKDVYNVKLKKKQYVDTLVLQESADKVTSFGVYGKNDDGTYKLIYKQDRIDKLRVCALDGMVTDELKVEIFDKLGNTKINSIKAYDSSNEKSSKQFRFVDYMTTEKKKLSQQGENAQLYEYFYNLTDVILIGEIGLNKNCDITYGEGEEDFEEDITNLNAIKVNVKNPGLRTIVSVGLNGLANNGAKKTNAEIKTSINNNIKKIVANIVAFAEKFNIDGIDFDWELPSSGSEWKAYSKLIVELSKELKKQNKFVTVALPSYGSKLTKEASSAVEFVNLMLYDAFDERGEHASFYETTKVGVEEFLKNGKFKAEQVMMGLSYYGRTTNQSAYAWPDYRWDYRYNNASLGKWGNYIKDFEYTDEKDGRVKICDAYVNGFAMTRDKTCYAIAKGLGGVMGFRMCCDAPADYEYSLHRAVADALKRGLKPQEAA